MENGVYLSVINEGVMIKQWLIIKTQINLNCIHSPSLYSDVHMFYRWTYALHLSYVLYSGR